MILIGVRPCVGRSTTFLRKWYILIFRFEFHFKVHTKFITASCTFWTKFVLAWFYVMFFLQLEYRLRSMSTTRKLIFGDWVC